MSEDQNFPLRFWQLADGLSDYLFEFRVQELATSGVGATGDSVDSSSTARFFRPPSFQALVSHGSEEICPKRRSARVIGGIFAQQLKEAFLDDVLGIRRGPHQSASETEQSGVVFIEKPAERRFPAFSRLPEEIHANCITTRRRNRSRKFFTAL